MHYLPARIEPKGLRSVKETMLGDSNGYLKIHRVLVAEESGRFFGRRR